MSQQALLERMGTAEKLIIEGNFRQAMLELEVAGKEPDLGTLSADKRQQWRQISRQAALLAELSPEPIEEILRHAASVREAEWLEDFKHRYRGKSLIFQAELRRSAQGRWELRYPFGSIKARLAVEDLQILQRVPGPGPEPVILGARLESVRLEPPGPTWVVRFQQDSGVFVTTPFWPVAGDADAEKTQKRMLEWLHK